MAEVVIFLRKKLEGQNSIEELAYVLRDRIVGVRLEIFPEYSTSIKGILRNILFAIKHSGEVNHLISPSESYVLPFISGKKIVTWHDLSTALQSRSKFRRFFRFDVLMKAPMRVADRLVAISKSTFDEIAQVYPKSKDKMSIIPNSYSACFSYSPKSFNVNCPMILHVGTGKRKNLERVISSLEGLSCCLHIVGKLTNNHQSLLESSQINYVQEEDVPMERIVQLYRECDIVSFPSLYEGFGMPIIEAQATGRPVLTSRRGAIPEVAKDSVCYVDPDQVDSIRAGFLLLIQDSGYREKLIQKGLTNVERYSPDNMISSYEKIYQEFS